MIAEILAEIAATSGIAVQDVGPVLSRSDGPVEAVGYLEPGEDFIGDEELGNRAVAVGANLGSEDAQLLYDNQDEMLADVPPEVLFIFFPGVRAVHENGAILIVYLYKKRGRWDLYVFWIPFGFSDKVSRLVRPKR
ncbi:MAG TPA: hypothetical protein VGA53_04185 [Candidatus Paceibacterota bacterium]